MKIAILDDYFDTVRTLPCFEKLAAHDITIWNDHAQDDDTLAERLQMLEEMVKGYDNVRVETFEGLLVDYAMQKKAKAVLRGIRAISDYEYELQMALMNRKLQPQLETVFMMPAEAYSYLSSRLVKEIFRLGGSVRGLVPELVEQRLREKFHGTAAKI